jgi:hypothetical protein
MKLEELKIGGYYTCIFMDGRNCIFQVNGTKHNVNNICKERKIFSSHGWNFYTKSTDIKPATLDERYHLDLCIEAGKFVPHVYDDIQTETYEIY